MKQITLMDAYLIEILRSNHVTNEEILSSVQNKQVETFKKYNENFDFTGLYALENNLASILEIGYQVKFLTMPGLMNLLRMKHRKEEDKDYDKGEMSLDNLSLTSEEKTAIEKWLSPNWTITITDNNYSIVQTYR